MPTLDVTADTWAAAIRKLAPQTTLRVKGEIPGDWRIGDVDRLIIEGGTFTGRKPLVFTRGRGLTLLGQRFVGGEPRSDSAVSIYGLDEVKARDLVVDGYRNGPVLSDVVNFDFEGLALSNLSADGFVGASVRKGRIAKVAVHGTRSYGEEHPDGVQLYSKAELPPTGDVVVEDCLFVGHINGFMATDHGTGGFDRLTVRRIRALISRTQGVGVAGARGLDLQDVDVSTLPGAEKQARVVLRDCENVVSRNVAWAAGAGRRASSL